MSLRIKVVILCAIVIALWALNFFAFQHACYGAERTYGDAEVHKLRAVYDGDTFAVDIKGWPPIIGRWISIRVADVNTPEMEPGTADYKKAKEAKWFTYNMLKDARHIKLVNIRRGRYFRIVADVYVDGRDLGDALILNGLAKRWVKWRR